MAITDTIAGVAESRSMTVPTAPSGRQPATRSTCCSSTCAPTRVSDAAVFVIVDAGRGQVSPAASWFASPVVEQAIVPAPGRIPTTLDCPASSETTLERGRAAVPAARGATGRRRRGCAQRPAGGRPARSATRRGVGRATAQASVIACPVRTPLGRASGVLGGGVARPGRPLTRADLDTVEVMADLAALALERSELIAAEAARTRTSAAQARRRGHGGVAGDRRRPAAGGRARAAARRAPTTPC